MPSRSMVAPLSQTQAIIVFGPNNHGENILPSARTLTQIGAALPAELVERLRIEAVCKPSGGGRIGF